jgi:hypothetical protein
MSWETKTEYKVTIEISFVIPEHVVKDVRYHYENLGKIAAIRFLRLWSNENSNSHNLSSRDSIGLVDHMCAGLKAHRS